MLAQRAGRRQGGSRLLDRPVIFKRVGDGRPYPDHGYVQKQWAAIAPHQVRLDQLVTTKRMLDLEALLEEDSTFYGDLFAHVVHWRGDYYLEDGLHRALRAALQQRQTVHARVLEVGSGHDRPLGREVT
jgi:Arc/MetJ family transcription regulator